MQYTLTLGLIAYLSITVAFTPFEPEVQECLSNIGLYPTGVDDSFLPLPTQDPPIRDTHWNICENSQTGCCSSYSPTECCFPWVNPISDARFTPSFWLGGRDFKLIRGNLTFSTSIQVEYECSLTFQTWADNEVSAVALDGVDVLYTWNEFFVAYNLALDFNMTIPAGSHILSFKLLDIGVIGGILVMVKACSCTPPPPAPPTVVPTTPTILCADSSCLQCDGIVTVCTVDGDYEIPDNVSLTITKRTVINGDMTTGGTIVLVLDTDTNASLNVSGCLVVMSNSSIVVDVSNIDTSSDRRFNAISSPCFNGSVTVINPNECTEIVQEQHAGGLDVLMLTNQCSNNNIGIIVGATVGAVVAVTLLFVLIAFVVPSVRHAVLPWNFREATPQTIIN